MSQSPPAPPPRLDATAMRAHLRNVPFAQFMDLDLDLRGDELTLIMPFRGDLIGNIALPALHGGTVGALLELAAVMTTALSHGQPHLPKTIDITIDYLRSGRPVATYARAKVTRLGRRIASVSAEAWQHERGDPIAALHGHFLLTPE